MRWTAVFGVCFLLNGVKSNRGVYRPVGPDRGWTHRFCFKGPMIGIHGKQNSKINWFGRECSGSLKTDYGARGAEEAVIVYSGQHCNRDKDVEACTSGKPGERYLMEEIFGGPREVNKPLWAEKCFDQPRVYSFRWSYYRNSAITKPPQFLHRLYRPTVRLC